MYRILLPSIHILHMEPKSRINQTRKGTFQVSIPPRLRQLRIALALYAHPEPFARHSQIHKKHIKLRRRARLSDILREYPPFVHPDAQGHFAQTPVPRCQQGAQHATEEIDTRRRPLP